MVRIEGSWFEPDFCHHVIFLEKQTLFYNVFIHPNFLGGTEQKVSGKSLTLKN